MCLCFLLWLFLSSCVYVLSSYPLLIHVTYLMSCFVLSCLWFYCSCSFEKLFFVYLSLKTKFWFLSFMCLFKLHFSVFQRSYFLLKTFLSQVESIFIQILWCLKNLTIISCSSSETAGFGSHTLLYWDNNSTLHIAMNLNFHECTKHLSIFIFFQLPLLIN